jgi:hypothetical protein
MGVENHRLGFPGIPPAFALGYAHMSC